MRIRRERLALDAENTKADDAGGRPRSRHGERRRQLPNASGRGRKCSFQLTARELHTGDGELAGGPMQTSLAGFGPAPRRLLAVQMSHAIETQSYHRIAPPSQRCRAAACDLAWGTLVHLVSAYSRLPAQCAGGGPDMVPLRPLRGVPAKQADGLLLGSVKRKQNSVAA